MEKLPFKKYQPPDFKDPAVQKAFIEEVKQGKELLQKELDINASQQNLLKKRIAMMKDFLNLLPASDPQYSVLRLQLQMDQIELDELISRALILKTTLSKET